MAKYFVTGATGFIGGEIVKQLVGRGHKVVALVRSPGKAAMLKALGVEMHAGDITDRETLKTPMTGVDGVFHVAAWYKVGVKEPHADQINVDGTRNVLKTMRTLEIPRGVYTSTVATIDASSGSPGNRASNPSSDGRVIGRPPARVGAGPARRRQPGSRSGPNRPGSTAARADSWSRCLPKSK